MSSFGVGEKHAQPLAAAKPESGRSDSTSMKAEESLFLNGGEAGALMRALDWSKTAVGPVSSWPQSLKTAVRIILASRFAMFVWWGEDLVNLYNDPYRAFLGRKHPEALGKSARAVWAEIWDQIGPRTEAVLLRGESTYDEALLLLMARHGYVEETYFTFSYSPLPDDTGKVGGLFCAVREETDQVIGERRLKLLREIAAAMVEKHTQLEVCGSAAACLAEARRDLPFTLLYLLDEDGVTLRKAAQTGFAGDEHAAAPLSVSIGNSLDAVWPFQQVIESEQPVLIEDLSSRFGTLPKGEWNDAPICAILLPIAQQGQPQPSGVFVAGLNPHRKFTEDYRGFVSLLANQIGGAIANAVAYESERKRAEALAELDRAKTQFFSNVSHEFRTPLTLMLGPLEEVLPEARERLSTERQEQLTVVRRNAVRLLKLVNTLLDFSRIEAGRVTATYEPTDLCQLTEEVSSVFRSAMQRAGLAFSVECEAVAEPVYVDREMWEKIVINLLSNAFKFTFTGGIAVRLRRYENSVAFSVSDTGTGIPEEEIPRVFERFHRIETARSRSFEGTGIGLSLVQELVKLHGGAVDVSSSLGRGTTFTVTLPLGKAHLPVERVQPKSQSHSTAFSGEMYVDEALRWLPQGSGAEREEQPAVSMLPSFPKSEAAKAGERELVLLADDNADMREYLAQLLREKYQVRAVADGEAAVDAARQLRPDLVLADVMMPGLDGFQLLHAIREDPSLSRTPVILLSARAGEESRVEGLNAGANDYLIKPFTARELLARVASQLAVAKRQSEHGLAAQRLAAIVESADDAIISKDLNGTVTSWNRAAERIFGYSADEMIGRSITTIIPPELQDDEPRILKTIARGERIDHFEAVRMNKSGERIDVSLTISPVRNESGEIVGAAKIARDITQQKKVQQTLHISERLASVGRLAATIAHEINNPLEAVTNLVYLAKETTTRNDVRGYLGAAEAELDRIAHLTKQTLGFYRETREVAAIRIGPMLKPLVSLFAGRAKHKGIDIQIEIEDDPEIYAVASDIRQVATNLLTNSIDAIVDAGKIRIRLSAAREERGARRSGVRLTVADSGTGVPRSLRSHIFEPFFTTKKAVGTGLGLWICKSIVERHGGSIRLKSSTAPGKSWTVFSIFLPSEKREAIAEELRLAV